MNLGVENTIDYLKEIEECRLCPRNCGVNRFTSKSGYCGSDASYSISSITLHKGEEPVISGVKGICNVFFSRCNLSCVYCQNYQISCRKGNVIEDKLELKEVLRQITFYLEKGINILGFVSPSHHIPQMKTIIATLREMGYSPTIVYNTNAYDSIDSLKSLEGFVDIYLPDFKYLDSQLSKDYSGAGNYPEIAKAAISEMYRQKGSMLTLDNEGLARSGMIIRHLVLPEHVDNSLNILDYIARELSADIHISLMAQYKPTPEVAHHKQLGRQINKDEYETVVSKLEELGILNGWIQEIESAEEYNPDFLQENPFIN